MGTDFDIVPYLIVLVISAIILFLFYLRNLLLRDQTNLDIQIGNGQTIGQRQEQDDYFSSTTTRHGTIAVLADGISGLANGRTASTLAVQTFIREFQKLDNLKNYDYFFSKAASLANTEILQHLKGSRGGTTLVSVIISNGLLYWGAVGDSILTIFRNDGFIYINQKDTLETVLEERYLSGEISRDEVFNNPQRKRLINYLGYEGFKNIEIGREPIPLQKTDKVLLLSDGVYNTLTEVDLEHILTQNLSPFDAAQEIIAAVENKKQKNQDNATVVILEKGW